MGERKRLRNGHHARWGPSSPHICLLRYRIDNNEPVVTLHRMEDSSEDRLRSIMLPQARFPREVQAR